MSDTNILRKNSFKFNESTEFFLYYLVRFVFVIANGFVKHINYFIKAFNYFPKYAMIRILANKLKVIAKYHLLFVKILRGILSLLLV